MILITKKDLTGQIADFPLKIVEMMVANQAAQGNPPNVRVFQQKVDASYSSGGFSWNKSPEGQFFWSKVINGRKFPPDMLDSPMREVSPVEEPAAASQTFDNAPEAQPVTTYRIGDIIESRENHNTVRRVIVGYFPELPNPYITITKQAFNMFMKGETNRKLITVSVIKEPERYVYLTLKDISEGKGVGVDPSLIKIVQ